MTATGSRLPRPCAPIIPSTAARAKQHTPHRRSVGSHSCAAQLPPVHVLPAHTWSTPSSRLRQRESTHTVWNRLGATMHMPGSLSRQVSLRSTHATRPELSENGSGGRVLCLSILATFILITEAPSNRCLVTNTFEIDLLTYYEML